MFGRLQLYALIGLAFIAGIFGIYAGGVQRGIDRTKRKMDERRLDNFSTAKEVSDEIQILDESGLADRASKWVRDKNGQ